MKRGIVVSLACRVGICVLGRMGWAGMNLKVAVHC